MYDPEFNNLIVLFHYNVQPQSLSQFQLGFRFLSYNHYLRNFSYFKIEGNISTVTLNIYALDIHVSADADNASDRFNWRILIYINQDSFLN